MVQCRQQSQDGIKGTPSIGGRALTYKPALDPCFSAAAEIKYKALAADGIS